MGSYIQSELLKGKRSFAAKMPILVPMMTVLLALAVMKGSYVQVLAYNWWYLLFLPFTVSYVSSYVICYEKKKNFHGLLGVIENKRAWGYGKVMAVMMNMVTANLVFVVLIHIVGVLVEGQISLRDNLLAGVVLSLTYAWQIPFCMLIALRTNVVIPVIISLVCNVGAACMCAAESLWWIPFAVPARMMCHILGILPNGLLVEDSSLYGSQLIVVSGILVTAVLVILMTAVLGKQLEKLEV